jgi:hypothetical protein
MLLAQYDDPAWSSTAWMLDFREYTRKYPVAPPEVVVSFTR